MYDPVGALGISFDTFSFFPQGALYVLVAVAAYLLGTLSPATMIARAKGVDIRKEGSGNPGTTNTLRVMGKKAAVVVLLVDVLKGTLAVALAGTLLGLYPAMVATLCVFLGHVYPVNAHFNGGKGVATAFGSLAALHPAIGFGCLAVVLIAVIVTRRVSFGSIFGALACPVLSWFYLREFLICGIVMCAVVIWRHRSNIQRIIDHEEPKLSLRDLKKKRDQ